MIELIHYYLISLLSFKIDFSRISSYTLLISAFSEVSTSKTLSRKLTPFLICELHLKDSEVVKSQNSETISKNEG